MRVLISALVGLWVVGCVDVSSLEFDCDDAGICPGKAPTDGGTGISCLNDVNCGANASCETSGSSYTCVCDEGYEGTTTSAAPATCTDVDECTFTNCGANTTCTNTAGSFECACATGFNGATVVGGPATCTPSMFCVTRDTCGANTTCIETQGTYTCSCNTGFAGPTTTGAPTTCTEDAPFTLLGSVADAGSSWTVSVPQAVETGSRVVVAAASSGALFTGNLTVTDSKGNTWVVLTTSAATSANTVIAATWVTNRLEVGDTIRAASISASSGAMWAARLENYVFTDASAVANGSTGRAHTAAVAAVPGERVLALGVLAAGSSTTWSSDSPALTDFTFSRSSFNSFSGAIVPRLVTASSGSVSLGFESNASTTPVGGIATFFRGPRVPPTQFTLAHVPNNRLFTASWTGGRGNDGSRGCQLQYQRGSTWSPLVFVNCDEDRTTPSELPAMNGWYGGPWNSVPLRLFRMADNTVLHTFAPLTCASSTPGSTSSTPDIDEDCDGTWDNAVCSGHAWVQALSIAPPASPCLSGPMMGLNICTSSNIGNVRYTSSSTQGGPDFNESSETYSSTCQGDMAGVQEWRCSQTNCTYY